MQTEIKRNILWVVFLTSLFFLWDNWNVSNGNLSFFAPPAKPTVTNTPKATTPPPISAAEVAANIANGGAAPDFKNEVITVTTDLFKADIDTLGGEIKRLELLKHRDAIDPKKNQVLFEKTATTTYLAQTGYLGKGEDGVALPNHNSGYKVLPGSRNLATGSNAVEVVLEAENAGVKVTKKFTFKRNDYAIGIRHELQNLGKAPISASLYQRLVHDGNPPANDNFFMSTYTGPTYFADDNEKFQKLEFSKLESDFTKNHGKDKAAQKSVKKIDNGWIAMVQQYFVSAFIPPEKVMREIQVSRIDTNQYAIANIFSLGAIAPSTSKVFDTQLYSGPQETSRLEKTHGFDLVKDYGVLTMLAKPMFSLMDFLHNMIGNWGWTIVAFTVMIKLALFPLSAASYKSMAKMKVVTPKIQAIRERHKDEPAKMNQAMMELYKTEKINPLGGCLPILVQMPVFLALYWVLFASVEIRNAPWIGWITDLAAPDPWYVLPVIYAISMYITSKLNPAPTDPMQAKMMLYMPLLFSVMFFFFPSGLVLYWVVNNIMSIGQQWAITRRYEKM